ncbi:branched-chain amino acid transport system II carrier protein [Clostridium tetani]|uniref:Branched-chain amino acid transport system carrier protein n=1 Tax=Clostridium tetani TaxID=1513 RepID=A0ABY0ETB0_CLOTA|nr:branched-chain amino acid transport system II carrier protein [Clostridium tetani]CDI50364.1 branched-chain amino acid transport systemcarrier protein [Clostridium tetani 12124569]KHO36257.1 branched-chain amino acid ABC transporter [Clostridium tetani]RXI39185.1 branched-chain amino acid transport system II carrier protein [Clostridium tetani]RXI55973.1 branched-chain amino acid transport system II carrier protein [Clostridium tetani]RXI66098.1 branched-chain amino acid transport system II
MKKSTRDAFVIGLALFAMFFGSGNLIFPPYLGKLVGNNYPIAILGFLITGVGLPLLGILSCAKVNGTFRDIATPVGKIFAVAVTTAIILAIGPMIAIPRTAATTYELSIQPFFPNINITTAIIVYFLINLAFVLRPSSIIDTIGKFLTPALLILLLTIIIKGILFPIAPIENISFTNVFSSSLLEGYQTMDATASVIFASIIIAAVRQKGYNDVSDIIKITSLSGIIAVIGLGTIYGGLMYLGSQTVNIFPADITKTALLTQITQTILGTTGSIFLALAVALACMTTSIGLTSSAAKYFEDVTNGKLNYKVNSIVISIMSILIASLGVDDIIAFAVPVLQILYPIVIVLVILTFLGFNHKTILTITAYTTLFVGILDNLKSVGLNVGFVNKFISLIPLSNIGFSWLIPAVIAFLFSLVYVKLKGNKAVNEF